MHITYREARCLAQKEVDASETFPLGIELRIFDSILVKEKGWVFFYNTKKYLETKDLNLTLLGNAPIFVSLTGVVHILNTFESWELTLQKMEII